MAELTREEQEAVAIGDYKYGFHDDIEAVFQTRRGLDEAVVREISAATSLRGNGYNCSTLMIATSVTPRLPASSTRS